MAQNLNLNEIKNIPEEEFKKHLLEWIENIDISKELHSKLRSDLFQKFGKTTLGNDERLTVGRQIALQYQQTQRIVLSPLVLVINTLVAEFLYAQNCHFSLSVFNSEVPFKNTLPDFESKSRFRFNAIELEEILQALGLVQQDIHKSAIVQSYETPQERDGILIDSSLLFCVIKTLIGAAVGTDPKLLNDGIEPSKAKDDDYQCHQCENHRKKRKKDELHSKYFKHFYKYLELLSQHVVEISENMKKLKESPKSNERNSKSSSPNSRLNKRLDKITESLKNLSKSNRKGRKVAEIIQSVTCLTKEIEKCSGNVAKYSMELSKTSKEAAKSPNPTSTYSEWLNQMSESVFGQRFMKNLEIAQEEAMTKKLEKVKEMFNEKLQTSRMLIKLHYKQKTLEKLRSTVQNSPVYQTRRDDFNDFIDEKLRLLKDKEMYWQQTISNGAVIKKPDDHLRPQSSNTNEVFNDRAGASNEAVSVLPSNEQTNILHKVETPIKRREPINIQIFEDPPHPIEPVIDHIVHVAKNRLQELEKESDELDKSFQVYIRNQNQQKQQLSKDIAKVWDQYEKAKDNMNKTFVLSQRYDISPSTRIHINEAAVPISFDDHIEEFKTTVNDCAANEFENPYKKLQENLTRSISDFSQNRSKFTTKKEIATQSDGNKPLAKTELSQEPGLVDKNNKTQIPIKIKSIIRKPIDIDSKSQLSVAKSQRNDQSSASDASSYRNLKSVSQVDNVHLSDSKPTQTAVKSKPSDNSMKSVPSPSCILDKSILEKNVNLTPEIITASGVTLHQDVEQKPIPLKENIPPIAESNANSTSSSSGKVNISTAKRSSSSDDFWK